VGSTPTPGALQRKENTMEYSVLNDTATLEVNEKGVSKLTLKEGVLPLSTMKLKNKHTGRKG
jgi:Flp pilus assembly protein CpaB